MPKTRPPPRGGGPKGVEPQNGNFSKFLLDSFSKKFSIFYGFFTKCYLSKVKKIFFPKESEKISKIYIFALKSIRDKMGLRPPWGFSQNLENFRFSGFCLSLYSSFGDHFFKTLKTREGYLGGGVIWS